LSVPDNVIVGRVGRPHGLDGSFIVEGASADERWFQVGARLLVASSEAEVIGARHGSGGRPVVLLDRPVPRGAALEVPRAALPATDPGEYYTFELVGLEVVEEQGRALGHVADVLPGVANEALELDSGLLLPLVEACIREIDLETGRIRVAVGFAEAD